MQEQEYLMVSAATEMVRLREEYIVCITFDGNYSHVCVVGGEDFVVAAQLGQIEQLISEQLHSSYGHFIRIGRGADCQHQVPLLHQHFETGAVSD